MQKEQLPNVSGVQNQLNTQTVSTLYDPVVISFFEAYMAEKQRFTNYNEFFSFYLEQHSDPRNRVMHACGTSLGILTVIVAFALGHPWWALLWIPIAYGFAWTGHFLLEGNTPATFGHPLWSFISDFRMLGLMLTGKLPTRGSKDKSAATSL